MQGHAGRARRAFSRMLAGFCVLCGALLATVPAVAAPAIWRVTPSAGRAGINELNGVSCSGQRFCAAVGGYSSSSHAGTLIEMWGGRRWSLTRSPSPGQDPNPGTLAAVSCPSASFCAAVGYYASVSLRDLTLIEIWNGKRWSISRSPSLDGYSHLLGVSCTSRSDCNAVGFYLHNCSVHAGGSSGLVERWDGHGWSVISSPRSPCGNTQLQAVSCSAASSCTAVGYYGHGASDRTLVESWDGMRWSIVPSPNANPVNNNELLGVSCAGGRSCVAAGWYQLVFGGPALTLAETWNGTRWSIVATPSPGTPRLGDSLTSVSCTGPANCVAAGDGQIRAGYAKTLIETWDGTSWHRTPSPNPRPAQQLDGVACTSGFSCEAVGDAGSSTDTPDKTLVETGSSGKADEGRVR